VLKLYGATPEPVEAAGLLQELPGLLQDANPMVVADVAVAMYEMNSRRPGTPYYHIDMNAIDCVLRALPSCTEWCQSQLLDMVARAYDPQTQDEA
jgi:hypothetical protein